MKPLDWNLLQSFVAVAETGSLLAAARRLGLTQPAIGRRITTLERQLSVTLFARGRNGMRLTEPGLALIDEAKAMEADANRFLLKAAGQDGRISGTVRITASRVVSIHILPPILARLGEAEPQIEIELVPENAVANLLARDADIAVRMVRPIQNDLIATRIADVKLGAFAHPRYLERRGTPLAIADLFHHVVIGYDHEDRMLQVMRAMGLPAERRFFTYRTDDEVAAWELVKAGAGIGFGQIHIARKSPELKRLLPDMPIPSLPVWLAAHQDLRTSQRIRRVMDFLREELRTVLAVPPGRG